MKRTALISFLAFFGAAPLAQPSLAADPAEMIAGLGEQLQFVARHVPSDRRPAEFQRLFEQDFDLPQIAGFVFGRCWRLATAGQQRQLLASFEDYLIATYGDRLVDYADRGETPVVTSARRTEDGAIVSSQVVLARNPTQGGRGVPLAPVRVDWRLVDESGAYKIVDVIVDGVSMAVTERLDFAEALEREGGELGALATLLRARTANAVP
jgi:phospholipid transport system substrate-binding protein